MRTASVEPQVGQARRAVRAVMPPDKLARRIGARRTILTHIAHDIDHTDVRVPLPAEVEIGHDGLVVDFA